MRRERASGAGPLHDRTLRNFLMQVHYFTISYVIFRRRVTWLARGFWLGAASMLAGCSGLPEEVSVTPVLRVAQEDVAYGPAALDRAVEDFIGPSASGAPSADRGRGTASGFLDLDRDAILGPGGSIRYETERAQEVAAGAWIERSLSATRALEAQFVVGGGRARFLLPDGAAAFKSPITIHARNRFAEVRGGISQTLPIGPVPGQAWLSAGTGLRVTESRLRVASDLLDVRSQSRQTSGFTDLRLNYRPDALPARGFAEARLHGRQRALILRAGLDITLP